MTRYWVSWYEPVGEAQDPRPRKWPLPEAIPHYWVSGWVGDMSAATLCAIVDARCEEEAKRFVQDAGWSPSSWRFCEERAPDWLPGDRFPVKP